MVASPPGRRAPLVAQHLQCPVSQWLNSESEAARLAAPPDRLLLGEAAAGPPQHYAESVVSSVNSRHELSVHSALRKLQRAIEKMKLTEECGEKQISHAQKVMSDCASKLSAKLDVEDDIEPQLLVVAERALEESEGLAESAMKQLDNLASSEREAIANVSALPRLSYETFSGDISQFPTFQQNQKEIFKMIEDKKAVDGGGGPAALPTQQDFIARSREIRDEVQWRGAGRTKSRRVVGTAFQ